MLTLSKGTYRVGVSLHLRTETDPVSETPCFSSNYLESGRWRKPENPVIQYDVSFVVYEAATYA
jgi:hypothetical protein